MPACRRFRLKKTRVSCSAPFSVSPRSNFGRDKVTIITSPAIYDLGAWLEQLVAESTGKEGKGLIPIDREALGTA